jgi:hypothetical protein
MYNFKYCVVNTSPKIRKYKKCIETKDAVVLVAHHEKCIKRPVQIVEKNVKFRLNRMVQNLYTVGTAINNTDQKDFSKKMMNS